MLATTERQPALPLLQQMSDDEAGAMNPEPCNDPLTIPARAAVRRACILPKGHKGYCKSADGRAWQTGTGDGDPQQGCDR